MRGYKTGLIELFYKCVCVMPDETENVDTKNENNYADILKKLLQEKNSIREIHQMLNEADCEMAKLEFEYCILSGTCATNGAF